MDANGNYIIAVDFDGTLSINARWPEIGDPNKPLFEWLIKNKQAGRRIILWTCRCGDDLKAAVDFCEKQGLVFDTINENLPELIDLYQNDCRKINADLYIDDKATDPGLVLAFHRHFEYMKKKEEMGNGIA